MITLGKKHIKLILTHIHYSVSGSFAGFGITDKQSAEYLNAVNTLFGTNIKKYGELDDLAEKVSDGWTASGGNMFFKTSGSTGNQKICRISAECYNSECESLKEIFKNCKRILSFVPSYHLYGFTFGVVLPESLGLEAVYFSPVPTAESLSEIRSGDAVIGFPVFWSAFSEFNSKKRNIMGVSSTGPLSSDLFSRLLENHVENMLEIYGASETGIIGYRRSPKHPFTLFDRFGGEEIKNIIPDYIEWNGENEFYLKGRIDNALQVGGINVYPEKINSIIQECGIVERSSVRLMKPSEGKRLKAFIVLKDKNADSKEALKHIKAWLESKNLTNAETVRHFTFGSKLPENDMGKAADWDI